MSRRSTPRSRLGCTQCKQRHVRCDQGRPICSNCLRIGLSCVYEANPHARRRGRLEARSTVASPAGVSTGQEHELAALFPDQNDSNASWSQLDFLSGVDASMYSADFTILHNTTNPDALFPGFAFSDQNLTNGLPSLSSIADAAVPDTPTLPVLGGGETARRRPCFEAIDTVDSRVESPPESSVSPTIKTNVRTHLLSYFYSSISPPASLLSMDSAGWERLSSHVLRMALRNEAAHFALLALSELYAEDNASSNPRLRERPRDVDAYEMYRLCCQKLQVALQSAIDDRETQSALLAAIFCLAWFQTVCDANEKAASQCPFPQDVAEAVITAKGGWCAQSRLILKCLNSIDAKASRRGGMQLLSSASLDVAFQHRFECENQAADESDDESEAEATVDGSASNESSRPYGGADVISMASFRSASTRNTRSPLPMIIKTNVLNALLQPALEFHIESQRYSRRIASHEHHHRKRDTAEDEYEVVTECKRLELELNSLWKRRPRILEMSMAELAEIVSVDIARTAVSVFRVYIVTFWAHFVHIHRTAWWNLPLSKSANKAMDIMWRIMRCSNTSQSKDMLPENGDAPECPESGQALHPGLLWALLLFGSECQHTHQQRWAVHQIRLIATSNPRPLNGSNSMDVSPQQQGAKNAVRVATLLEELIRRQTQSGTRLHWESLSVELFQCHFSII